MADEEIAQYLSTKKLSLMVDLSRQRIDALQKDRASGFPKPAKIGRSVRHCVADVLEWMRTRGAGSDVRQATEEVVKRREGRAERTEHCVGIDPKPGESLHQAAPHAPQYISDKVVTVVNGRPITIHRTRPAASSCAAQKVLQVEVRVRDLRVYLEPSPPLLRNTQDGSETPQKLQPAVLPEANSLSATAVNQADGTEQVSADRLKADYEAGLILDALCKRYRLGKAKVSLLLRQAGTAMRRPGRASRGTATHPPSA